MISFVRRLIASALDAPFLLFVPLIFWHWAEWMRQTSTFYRVWPDAPAFAMMSILPITVVWLEGITGRGWGKQLTGLRLANADGTEPTVARSLWRSAIKWSPLWIGPVGRIVETATRTNYVGRFAQDITLSTPDAADTLGKGVTAFAGMWNVAALGMSIGIFAVAVMLVGHLLVLLPGKRSLLDRLTGTRVIRQADRQKPEPLPMISVAAT